MSELFDLAAQGYSAERGGTRWEIHQVSNTVASRCDVRTQIYSPINVPGACRVPP